jgi:hypothetical protein
MIASATVPPVFRAPFRHGPVFFRGASFEQTVLFAVRPRLESRDRFPTGCI